MHTESAEIVTFLPQLRGHHHYRTTREVATVPQTLNHFLTRLAGQALIQDHKIEYRIRLQELDGFVSVTGAHHIRDKPGGGEGVQEESDIAIVIVTDEYGKGHRRSNYSGNDKAPSSINLLLHFLPVSPTDYVGKPGLLVRSHDARAT
jgi:hypothetical protein